MRKNHYIGFEVLLNLGDAGVTIEEALEFDEATTEEGYFLDEYDRMNTTSIRSQRVKQCGSMEWNIPSTGGGI